MGYRGLALGTAIAALFNALALLVLLGRRIGGLDSRRVTISLVKIVAASAVMGVAAQAASQWLAGVIPGTAWYIRMVHVFGAIAVGVLVLLGTARLLGIAELTTAIDRIVHRVARR
jgi:putative peptidoglycan lipid II flippase